MSIIPISRIISLSLRVWPTGGNEGEGNGVIPFGFELFEDFALGVVADGAGGHEAAEI